jgi:outer membrane protein insertion porin family
VRLVAAGGALLSASALAAELPSAPPGSEASPAASSPDAPSEASPAASSPDAPSEASPAASSPDAPSRSSTGATGASTESATTGASELPDAAPRPLDEEPSSPTQTTPPLAPPPAPPCSTDELEEPRSGHVRYTIESIEIRGNTRTRARVILRYLPFSPGDILDVNSTEVTLARYRLLGTGYFRDVQFSLRKGTTRGQVVLVVDVTERNTVVLNGFWLGVSADADADGEPRPLTAFGGADVSENNLAGTGITLGGAVGLAKDQYALRLRVLDPSFLGTSWMLGGTLLYNHAVDFFGTKGVLWDSPDETTLANYAVVRYNRFGGMLGMGRDLSVSSQFWLHYRLETISAHLPLLASQQRGGETEPIDFDIIRGRSILSTLRANFQIDTRDHPFLPTEGWFVATCGEVGLLPLGGDYDYQRFDVAASRWWKIPSLSHVFRLQMFAGAMSGNVPFFEQYYVGDFSDFLPARVLGLNFDRRPPPNLLDTSIEYVRYGHYAMELAGEYRIPVYRGTRSVYGIDFFARGGIYGVAHPRDITEPVDGYSGLSRIPVDLTANLGFRLDTSAGGVVFSFSNVLGFVPLRGGSAK